MLIWDDGFISEFMDEHTLCITGRLGSGKSCLALEIAEHFLKRGYYLATNMSTVWNDDMATIPMDKPMLGIVDEGGIYVRTAKTANMLAAFLRKSKSKLIFSGKKLPHESLSGLQIYLWFDFYKNFALPFKLWRWDNKVQATKRYSGYVIQTGWQDYFGTYSSVDPGDFPQEVVYFFEERAKYVFAKYNRKYDISDVAQAGDGSGDDGSTEFARDMASMADTLAQNVSLPGGKRGGRFGRS